MTHSETIEAIKLAQSGDEEAKTLLVKENVPLIKSIVRRYKYKQVEYEDLVELGMLGLVKAINNFNTDFEVRFSTYAVPMIAGEIKRFIRDDGAVKVSRNTKSVSQKINKYIDAFKQDNLRDPTLEEIGEVFNLSTQEVVFTMESSKYPVSIFSETEEDGLMLLDKIPSKGSIDDTIEKCMLKSALESLPSRERDIIIMRYYEDKTQGEIAERLGISQVQVSRLESKILEKIRKEIS